VYGRTTAVLGTRSAQQGKHAAEGLMRPLGPRRRRPVAAALASRKPRFSALSSPTNPSGSLTSLRRAHAPSSCSETKVTEYHLKPWTCSTSRRNSDDWYRRQP